MPENSNPIHRAALLQRLPDTDRRRAIRQAAGLSLYEVARGVEVTPQAVLSWEQGRSVPSGINLTRYVELLEALSAVLHGPDPAA